MRRIVIVGVSTVFVYDFPSLKKIDEHKTYENTYGLISVNSKAEAILNSQMGSLQVIVRLICYGCNE